MPSARVGAAVGLDWLSASSLGSNQAAELEVNRLPWNLVAWRFKDAPLGG